MQEAKRSPVASDFGRLLRHYRLSAGLSQEALAERACMSAFAISALERGHRRRPQLRTLALLADALDLAGDVRAQFEAAARAGQQSGKGGMTVGPWRTSGAPAPSVTNLPRQVAPLIGREGDLQKLASLLRQHPLVTLVGAGGVGKTRLALEAGETLLEEFPDGVWVVEFAGLGKGASPVQSIASTFGLGDRKDRALLDVVLGHLQHRSLLLIADNCEHVVDEAAAAVDAVLRNAPHVRAIATSREPLRIPAEHVYRVHALAVPRGEALTARETESYSAIELFVERAQAAQPEFELTDENADVVAGICARLDGIPLAIELAAGRASVLAPSEIAERLDHRSGILAGSKRAAAPRQQTLRSLIGWSYDLLPQDEQRAFRRLGVFSGGFSLQSAAAVQEEMSYEAAFDMLASLADKSLVHAETIDGKTRLRLLQSVRAFAQERLAEHNELDAAALAHARAYLALAERLESEWDGTPDIEWKARAEPEMENWRAALRWAFGPGGERGAGLGLAVALRPVWFTLAPAEGLAWVRTGLQECGESRSDRIRAWLELSASHLAMVAQRYGDAAESAQRAVAFFSELDDKKGTALSRLFLGASRGMLGEAEQAQRDLRAALDACIVLGERRAVGATLLYMGALELGTGDAEAARRYFAEAFALLKSLGASRPAAHVALNLAEIEFKSGNPTDAARLAGEALEADGALNDRDAVAYDLCNLAAYEVALADWDGGASHAREALVLARERGLSSAAVWAIQHLAAVASLRPASGQQATEQRRRGARLVGYVDACVAQERLQRDFTERREREQIQAAADDALGSEIDPLMREGAMWPAQRAFEESLLV